MRKNETTKYIATVFAIFIGIWGILGSIALIALGAELRHTHLHNVLYVVIKAGGIFGIIFSILVTFIFLAWLWES